MSGEARGPRPETLDARARAPAAMKYMRGIIINENTNLLLRVLTLLLILALIKATTVGGHEMVQVSWPSTYPSMNGAHIFWACAGWKSKSIVESVPACRIMLRSPAGCLCKNVVTS